MLDLVIKQPNGLYCTYSTVVDAVTHWNMTEEEYIKLCAEKSAEAARNDAKKRLKNNLTSFDMLLKELNSNDITVRQFLKEVGHFDNDDIRT